jgi:hypothetical protein
MWVAGRGAAGPVAGRGAACAGAAGSAAARETIKVAHRALAAGGRSMDLTTPA